MPNAKSANIAKCSISDSTATCVVDFYTTNSCDYGSYIGESYARNTGSSCVSGALRTRAPFSYSTKRSDKRIASRVTVASVVSVHWAVEPGPSGAEVTRIISDGAYSFSVEDIAGICGYDGAQGVFVGHLGVQTADPLKNQLLPFVRNSLNQIRLSSSQDSFPEQMVQGAIIKGFLALDDSIIKAASDTAQSSTLSLHEKVKKLAPAYSGSCALLSLFDPSTSTLHVACTGDSRAVLGQTGPDGTWKAVPLSVDQTGNNQDEVMRLQKEHPGEDDIVKNGRVLGIMVSRAFGDCQWKWPMEFQKEMQRQFYGPILNPKYNFQSPPYLTAEPVVTSTKIDPASPSFLILATDGLWDLVSNRQAVDLVGKWLEMQAGAAEKKGVNKLEPTNEPFDFGHFWNGVSWKFEEGRTTVQDDNVAMHLVRNALGGNHHELISGRLAFDSLASRRVRDDITVQVVFFDAPLLKDR
ncbi:phosphatase 2C-like domain-containing protein [Aspergillus crustosus]